MNRKQIPGFMNYEITRDGRIWSKPRKDRRGNNRRGKWLKLTKGSRGYLHLSLCAEGKIYTRSVHQLVLETYVGPCPPGMETRHLDGTRTNNQLDNLCWGTKVENTQDQVRHGTFSDRRGEKHGGAKLTESIVILIRQLWSIRWMGVTQTELADMFGVSRRNIAYIVHRKSWTHI